MGKFCGDNPQKERERERSASCWPGCEGQATGCDEKERELSRRTKMKDFSMRTNCRCESVPWEGSTLSM